MAVQLTVTDGMCYSTIHSGLLCQVVFPEWGTPILPLSVQFSRHELRVSNIVSKIKGVWRNLRMLVV